ncbi:MAG: orotidine-5'-phosphate decarboxylase [Flavobacteriaceae bacterium]|nr:orotidine-5'-phosphate decarboxylase [Muriicola sp.]NNL39152.1 orotidine-5'-phosphate decarboxylase [Flavobacteriaceae bacterium]
MSTDELVFQIRKKNSFLCIGLDTDPERIPPHLMEEPDPVFAFNKAIVDATHHLCVAYKPNTAFYEANGIKGWESLSKTINYIDANYPEIFTIADAKRGDIGNTATMYAKAFFEDLKFDAVTVAPYMGRDSVEPFLNFKDKFTILLALTSNPGAFDFQTKRIDGKELYKQVLETALTYENPDQLMFVVGATKAEFLKEVRRIVPKNFLLVPGVGAQGGSLEEVCKHGITENIGLLINSSRGIIYASRDKDFAEAATAQATLLQQAMTGEIKKNQTGA